MSSIHRDMHVQAAEVPRGLRFHASVWLDRSEVTPSARCSPDHASCVRPALLCRLWGGTVVAVCWGRGRDTASCGECGDSPGKDAVASDGREERVQTLHRSEALATSRGGGISLDERGMGGKGALQAVGPARRGGEAVSQKDQGNA